MIGKKRRSEVRASLLAKCAEAGIDPARWFDKQIERLEQATSPKTVEIETLKLVRDGLRAKPSRTKRSRKRAQTRSAG